MPSDFESLQFVSRTGKFLEQHTAVIPVPDMEMIRQLDDKFDCYVYLQNHGLDNPKTIKLDKLTELPETSSKEFDFPVLLKPRIAAGGKGIVKFRTLFDIDEFLDAENVAETAGDNYLLQEFIDGVDYCFNGYAYKGKLKAWTVFRYVEFDDKNSKGLFVEFIQDEEILDAGTRILEITQYTGPIVIDFIKTKTDNKLYVIEINPRFGNNTHYSIRDGVNFPDVGIQLAANANFTVTPLNSALWSCSIKRLFSAPIRNLDFSAIPYIYKIGIPQVWLHVKEKYFRTRSVVRRFTLH